MIDSTSALNTRLHELDQYWAAGVYYHFLTDFADGCRELLSRYEHAEQVNDTYFQDLMVLYLQRFLPGGNPSDAFNDVVRLKLEEFRSWLGERPERYITLALLVARHQIETSQSGAALGCSTTFLKRLITCSGTGSICWQATPACAFPAR